MPDPKTRYYTYTVQVEQDEPDGETFSLDVPGNGTCHYRCDEDGYLTVLVEDPADVMKWLGPKVIHLWRKSPGYVI